LEERLRRARTTKYHLPPRFDVIDYIEKMGWIDTLYANGKSPREWVTAPRERSGVHIDYRTDYIFASPAMARHLTVSWVVPMDNESDHHPVMASFTRTPLPVCNRSGT